MSMPGSGYREATVVRINPTRAAAIRRREREMDVKAKRKGNTAFILGPDAEIPLINGKEPTVFAQFTFAVNGEDKSMNLNICKIVGNSPEAVKELVVETIDRVLERFKEIIDG